MSSPIARFLVILGVSAAFAAGCSSSSSPAEEKVAAPAPAVTWTHLTCDPLVPTKCGFPFPSNVYTADDPTTPTKRRVQIDDATIPVALNGGKSTAAPLAKSDGFSGGATLLTHMQGATLEGQVGLDDVARSVEPGSPSLVLDADTGKRVPHYVEIDHSRGDADQRTFMIRPVVALEDGHRYIVALRKVRGQDGNDLEPTPAFRALRDLVRSDEPSVDARRPLYEDIFAKLGAAGVERGSLQIAWDFTTASRENVTGWLLHMRDEALAKVGPDGPAYVIDEAQENPEERVAFRLKGHMTVPLYLDKPEPGSNLVFGPDGMPEPNAARPTYDVGFDVMIPKSALTKPAALLQYGHGLLGTSSQIGADNFKRLTNDKGYIIFGVNLVGMSDDDRPYISQAIADGHMHELSAMFDRLHQGFLNSVLAMRMMMGGFAKDPKYGKYVDPTQRYYHGISQGGIMGAVYMALSTDVERGALSVMGQPYTFLLNRSVDFAPFFLVLSGSYPDPRDQQFMLAMVQMLWDRVEPSGWSKHIPGGLPNTPAHAVLMSAALGDHQVATFGAHVMARTVGAKHLESGVRDVFGLEKVAETANGSAFIEYDFGLPPEPRCNVPMSQCEDPHGLVRKLQANDDQIDRFLRTGVGANDCNAKACRFPEQSGCTGGAYPDLCAGE